MSDAKQPAKRGRKPRTIEVTAEPFFDPQRLEEAGEAPQVLQQLAAVCSDERDLANQLLGQIQMANALGKWTTVVYLSKLEQVRKSKLYRALPAKNVLDENGSEIADCRLNTWDGYCRALGLSANKVEEDLLNLKTFGEEALESMSRMGIGYREMRQYRKLPEDQRIALIEVAKAGDKEGFVDLAEQIIAKHVKDSEAKDKEMQHLRDESTAKDKVIAQGKEHIAKLVDEKNRRDRMTEAELHAELDRDLAKATLDAVGHLFFVRSKILAISAMDKLPQGLRIASQNALQRLSCEVMDISTESGMECDWQGSDWLRSADAEEVDKWMRQQTG